LLFFALGSTLKYRRVDENIFGVSDAIQKFFNMGYIMLGCHYLIITTILASISWQLLVASSAFPNQFLFNNLLVYYVHYFVEMVPLSWRPRASAPDGAWFLGINQSFTRRLRDSKSMRSTLEPRKTINLGTNGVLLHGDVPAAGWLGLTWLGLAWLGLG
jgi:hypothetical protein